MAKSIFVHLLGFYVAVVTNCHAQEAAESQAERVAVNELSELDGRLGEWVSEEHALENDIPGFANKGEMVRLHVKAHRIFSDERFQVEIGELRKGDQSVQQFHMILGPRAENETVNAWSFTADFPPMVGPVYRQGDTIILDLKAELTATKAKGKLKALADAMNLDKITISGEMHFQRRDDSTIVVSPKNSRVNGQPIPLPGTDKAMIMKRQVEVAE